MRGLRCAELFEEQVLRINIDAAAAGNLWVSVHAAFSIYLISAMLNTPLSHLSVPLPFALPKSNVGLSSVTGIQSLCGKPLKIFLINTRNTYAAWQMVAYISSLRKIFPPGASFFTEALKELIFLDNISSV